MTIDQRGSAAPGRNQQDRSGDEADNGSVATNWNDQTSAWWAKLAHARLLSRRLSEEVSAFEATDPIIVTTEPSDDRTAYRVNIRGDIPIEVSLLVGDILHNLRSAFDALVFGFATEQKGAPLNSAEQGAVHFPICDHPNDYANVWGPETKRSPIWSERLDLSLRVTQPFFPFEEMRRLQIESAQSYADQVKHNSLRSLRLLSNIDKHRRVATTQWAPDISYWFGEEGDPPQGWIPTHAPLTDGAIVGHSVGGGPDGQRRQVVHEFNIVLTDVPGWNEHPMGSSTGVEKTTEGWIWATQVALDTSIGMWHRYPTWKAAQDDPGQ